MRFCDFFVEYKLRMKSVNSVIRYDEQPRYRLALFGLFIIFATLFAIFAVSNVIFDDMFTVYMGVSAVGMFIIIVIMGILDSIRKNKERLLEEIWKPYSTRRMNVFIQLLQDYSIDINDSQKLDLIVGEAKSNKAKNAPWAEVKKPLGMMGTIVASAFGILFKNYVDTHDIDYISIILFMVIIVLAVYAIGYVLYIMLKDFIYMDGKRYDDLIDDINQVKIFASAGGEEIEELGDVS